MKAKVNRVTISIQQNVCATAEVDAIVNATDPGLTIPPSLATLAGPTLAEEAAAIGWCNIGFAVVTGAGSLPAQRVIHAVEPRWGEDSVRGKLANLTWEILQLTENNRLRSVAIPALGTGTSGYPVEAAARIIIEQIIDFSFEPLKFLRSVLLCLKTPAEVDVFSQELQRQVTNLKDAGDNTARMS